MTARLRTEEHFRLVEQSLIAYRYHLCHLYRFSMEDFNHISQIYSWVSGVAWIIPRG